MIVPGYDILEKIGEDRLTQLWKANQVSLNREVTLKILRPEFSTDSDQVRDYLAEGRMIAKLKHPCILQVYDVIEQQKDKLVALVVEPLIGPSLASIMETEGALAPKKALGIALKLAEALSYAWTASHIIHRNLKPENIYIKGDDVRISFFGHCKIVNPMVKDYDDGETLVGTPYYMAPEQAACRPDLDTRADMYGLGAVLYHAITGKTPFDEFDPVTAAEKQISAKIPHPQTIIADLPRGYGFLMERLMAKDRNDRPINWDSLLGDIRKLLDGKPMLARLDAAAQSTIESATPRVATVARSERSGGSPAAPLVGKAAGAPFWMRAAAWGAMLVWWYRLARFMTQYWITP